MAFCLVCDANVEGERLRECVMNGHQILWATFVPNKPTISKSSRREFLRKALKMKGKI
jgi:hypothetical protein